LTSDAIAALHALTASCAPASEPPLPAAVFKPACKECSLYAICLPELVSEPESVTRAAEALFKT
jgi:hypothetical protein